MALVYALALNATSWVGDTPIAGEKYFLYNVGAKKFLAHGDQWGYQALKDEVGLEVTLEANNGAYRINTGLGYLKTDCYVDGGTNNQIDWTITKVNNSNIYTISNGDSYLSASTTNRYFTMWNTGTSDNSKWKFVTMAERERMLHDHVGSPADPLDISYKIVNNRTTYYTRCYTGDTNPFGLTLTGDGGDGGDQGGAFRDRVGEYWSGTAGQTWNKSLTFKDLPQGKYRFYVTGYYRDGTAAEACTRPFDPQAKIYISTADGSGATTDLQSIRVGAKDESQKGGNTVATESTDNGKYFPDNMVAASFYFLNDCYPEQSVEGSVGENGQLTIGLRIDQTIAENWVCVDKFRLEYVGRDITATPVADKILNPSFDGWDSWTTTNGYQTANLGAITATSGRVAEAFGGYTFNIYQNVTLDAGVYKVEMQGFFRDSRNSSDVSQNYENDPDNYHSFRASDVARYVRVKGAESLSSFLYATVGGTERKTPLLSIFDEGLDHEQVLEGVDLWHGSILATVPGSMTVAHMAFEEDRYLDNSVIFYVPNNNTTVTLGIKNDETPSDREWTCFDNIVLYKMDHTLNDALRQEWVDRKTEANAVLHGTEYINVPHFSKEYKDLETTLAANPTTDEEYYTQLANLRTQLNAFKASKYWYDRFLGVYQAALALGVTTEETYVNMTVGQAEDAIHTLVTAIDSHVVTTGSNANYGDITSSFLKDWTVQQFANISTTDHWSQAEKPFYHASSGDTLRVMEQELTLQPGNYVLKLAGRSSGMDLIHQFTVTLGNNTVHLPTAGFSSKGINTSGAADYTSGDKGWEWRYVVLTIPEGAPQTVPLRIAFEHTTEATMGSSVADIQLLADVETLQNLLEFYAEKMRKKIVEVDAAYYGSGPNNQFEEHVADLFKTKNSENTYDKRDTYTYNNETITASAASTSIGLVNFYKKMHGASLSPDLYRKAYQVMQTKIDMADANAVTYVYARRALIRAKQFEQSRGDVYTVSNADMTAFNATLTTLDDELKEAILKVRGLNTGTTETPPLNTPENIANSWDDNTNWIRDDYKTSITYQKCLDDIRAATRQFISKITVNEGKQLEITNVFLFNPSFDFNNPYGWTDNGSTRPHNCNTNTYRDYLFNGAAVETTYVNHYIEYYQWKDLEGAVQGPYNSFQTITGLPYGAYKLTATGSYRRSGISNSPQQRANGDETISAELYASGTHMTQVEEEYEETVIKMENGNPVLDSEGNPVTEVVTKTRLVNQIVTDTDRSMPLFSIYTKAEETEAYEGIGNDERGLNTVYGAVPIDFNNYMPVVEHYEGNTVMFSVTRNDGEEDITVGIRDKGYNYQAWTVVDDFRLFYISSDIVGDLSEEWTKRVEEAKGYYNTHPSPQGSVYGVALAEYLNSYDPTTAINDSELEIGEDMAMALGDVEKKELKYNLALRRLHIALNDYEAATYWFDELARANKVAESFPYVSGAFNGKYDEQNKVTATAVTSTMTMVDAREAAHSVRAQADQISAYYDRNDEDKTIIGGNSTAVSLGSLNSWTVASGSKNIAQWSGQTFKENVYYFEPEGCFGLNSWTFNISKEVTLLKGVYILKVAARRSGGVKKCDIKVSGDYVGMLTPAATDTYPNYYALDGNTDVFNAGTVTLDVPRTYCAEDHYSGDKGYGIATDGSTSYENGNNYGWQWEYVPFAVSKAGTVTFTIDAESKSLHTWASFAEPQLLQGPVPLYINGEPAQNATSETKTWDLEPCYANVTAKRNIAANGNWNTLVLPFETSIKENWDVQYLFDQDQRTPQDHVTVYFQRERDDNIGKIIAGKPYIIMNNNTGTAITEIAEDRVDVIGTTTKVETNDVEMYGTLTHHDVEADGWHFYIAQNNFYRVADANKESGQPVPMKPLRAYFRMKHETASTQARLNFITGFGGDASSVDGIIGDSNGIIDGPVYDLQGLLVAPSLSKAHLRPGVYVVNGRKRIVK